MSCPDNFQDVHRFDGQWKDHNIKSTISKDEKSLSFNHLICMIEELKLEDKSVEGLKLIADNSQQQSNYDASNNIYADDILMEFYNLLQYLTLDNQKIFIYLLAEQMNDIINLGQCQSGKCTRLFQLYKSLNESLKDQITITIFPEFIENTIELNYRLIVI